MQQTIENTWVFVSVPFPCACTFAYKYLDFCIIICGWCYFTCCLIFYILSAFFFAVTMPRSPVQNSFISSAGFTWILNEK